MGKTQSAIKLGFILALAFTSSCSPQSYILNASTSSLTYEEHVATLKPLFDWGAFATDGYEDIGLTTPVTHESPVNAYKTFGNSPPANQNLFRVTPDYVVGNVWHGNTGVTSRYYEYGAYDRFMNVYNALGHSYESNPGQVPLADGYVDNLDMVYGFRLWHGVFDEAIGLGLKWRSSKVFDFYGQNGEVFTSAVILPKFGTDYLLRVNIQGLSVNVYLNDDLIITGTLNANYRIYDFSTGTNSHPLAHHLRFWGIKKGQFTTDEINQIKSVTNILWPRDGTLPSFPYISGLSPAHYTDFNATTHVWTLPHGTNHLGEPIVFSGGTGVAGTHLYQWYYGVPSNGNPIDFHTAIAGATGPTLDRDDYKGVGQPFNGHEGDAYNQIFCVITPVDSAGVQGHPIISDRYSDNIP